MAEDLAVAVVEAAAVEAGNTMENKQMIPLWQWILLGVLGVVFVGVIVRYMMLSGIVLPVMSVPGFNRESSQMDAEYIPEPTPEPGT